jgi:hypothetical protein
MCRNIKTLHNFRPPATDEEIRASSLQFVRKLSGCTRPSKTNQVAFDRFARDQRSAPRPRRGGLEGSRQVGSSFPILRGAPRPLNRRRSAATVAGKTTHGSLRPLGGIR